MVITAPRKADLDLLRLKGRIVPTGGILPYFGTMDLFSATGMGQVGTIMEGWAVCNGLNGTVDMRGMVPLGATDVPSSGAPDLYAGVSGNSDPGDGVGGDLVTIEADQLPEHTHPLGMPTASYWSASGGGANITSAGSGDGTDVFPAETQVNATTGSPISVKQASRSLVFIQSIL
jgi:hypothetical protein